jgi:cysteine desulfurase/selenocysteine lyase
MSYSDSPPNTPPNTHADPIANFRSQFSTERQFFPFNNAGTSLLSKPARETIEQWTRRFYDEGVFAIPSAYQAIEPVRADLARLLGAETVAFFPNTAAAISQVALRFPLKADDEVITWDQEYPSNYYPWQVACQRVGAKLIIAKSGPNLETPVETLRELITPKTRAIAFSWVQYRSGAVTDFSEVTKLARERGIFTCADIIQGAGILPFHFGDSGLDAACGGSHKWMCAVPSAAYLCLKPEQMVKFEPLFVGANTFGTSEDPVSLTATAKLTPHRFEAGSMPLLDILALGASVRLIANTGVARIAQEAEWLAKKLIHGLQERGYQLNSPHGSQFRGAIVNFSPGPNARFKTLNDVMDALKAAKIAGVARQPGVRLSCHAFNTSEDIAYVLGALT